MIQRVAESKMISERGSEGAAPCKGPSSSKSHLPT